MPITVFTLRCQSVRLLRAEVNTDSCMSSHSSRDSTFNLRNTVKAFIVHPLRTPSFASGSPIRHNSVNILLVTPFSFNGDSFFAFLSVWSHHLALTVNVLTYLLFISSSSFLPKSPMLYHPCFVCCAMYEDKRAGVLLAPCISHTEVLLGYFVFASDTADNGSDKALSGQ